MNEELRNLCTKLVQYYVGLEEVLKPTNEEIDLITRCTLLVNVYNKAKRIKEEHLLAFDRNICVEFLNVIDYFHDHDLIMSLPNPEQYNKKYSDEEIERNEDLNKIKNMSVLEIDGIINSCLLGLAYAKFYKPLERLKPYMISHRKDKDENIARIFSLFENFTLDDINTYGIDIINEVQEDKIRDSFNDQYSEIIVTVSNNILRDIINVTNGNEKTEIFEPVFLLLTVDYYKYHHFIFKLSEKEQKILMPYFDGLTDFLRKSYPGNKLSILVERLYKLLGTDVANTLFDKIHNYPELSWVHVDLPAIAVPDEWSVPEDFFRRPTYGDPKEFIGVVYQTYRDPAFIKSVVDEFANMNNIAPTPLAKQWTLFLLTGIEKPQSVKPSGSIWKEEVNDLLYVCKHLYKEPVPNAQTISGLYKKAVDLFGATTLIKEKDMPAYAERHKSKTLVSLFEEQKKKKR